MRSAIGSVEHKFGHNGARAIHAGDGSRIQPTIPRIVVEQPCLEHNTAGADDNYLELHHIQTKTRKVEIAYAP